MRMRKWESGELWLKGIPKKLEGECHRERTDMVTHGLCLKIEEEDF
jgi:hypothetical protein